MKKLLLLLLIAIPWGYALAQNSPSEAVPDTPVGPWKKTLSLGLSYHQVSLDNPLVGDGQNQISGTAQLHLSANYDKKKIFSLNEIVWKFGLLRIGSGPIEPGASRGIPFQKTLDRLILSSLIGHRISQDSSLSLISGAEVFTQALPAYVDPEGKLPGLFLRDIRDTNADPIQSTFFAPATIVFDVIGIAYKPDSKLFVGYAPAAVKSIVVFNDTAARLVGKVDEQGMPTATVHGNPVEIINGNPVFKKSFHQFGSRLLAIYVNTYLRGRFSLNSRLQLFSNYLDHPERIDIFWQNRFDLNLIKGLSLSYNVDLFYDHDVLVRITDKNASGGFTGEFGRRVALGRILMLRYQVAF